MHSPLLKKIYTKNPKGMGNLAKNDEIQSKFPYIQAKIGIQPTHWFQCYGGSWGGGSWGAGVSGLR